MSAQDGLPEIRLDPDNLYHEEVFTDRRVGTIMRLTPVKSDGSPDGGREVLYVGQASLMTPMGSLPLSFPLDAKTMDDAIRLYPDEAQKALERTVEELKEMRREQASSIITADKMPGGGMPGGGMPGGGIQMP